VAELSAWLPSIRRSGLISGEIGRMIGGSHDDPADAPPTDDGIDGAPDAAWPAIDLGVTWTPFGYPAPTAQDRMAFYTGHAAYGNVIAVHRPWRQNRASTGNPDPLLTPIASEATTYGFDLMYGYGFDVDDAGGSGSPFFQIGLRDSTGVARPSDAAWRARVSGANLPVRSHL